MTTTPSTTTSDSTASNTSVAQTTTTTTTNLIDIKATSGNGLESRVTEISQTTTTTTTTTAPITNNDETGGEPATPFMANLEPEVEYGNVEYKLKLIKPTEERLEHLISQLKWRMGEAGEAIYDIGVEDDGTAVGLPDEDIAASMETLKTMASRLNSDLTIIRERKGTKGKVLEVLIRKYASDDFTEVRVTVVGNVDAGKSTLLGVLTRGQLDNGRGLARMNVFRHKHEIESGRTSSISQEVVGFDSKGKIVNYTHNSNIHNDLNERISSKIITFIDLAGHEKYLKTTLFGMTGHQPDYAMLMIGANMGCVGMTKEHLGIALALRVPVFIVITKIDRCPENVLQDTMNDIKKILKSPGSRKLPVVIRNQDDVVVAARNFISERIAPIFCISNVTGENLDLLKSFLNLLPAKKEWDSMLDKPSQLDIDSIWQISGVGTVVSGTVMKGTITAGENLLIGPDDHGQFQSVLVKSIHSKRLPIKQVRAGQTASLALKKIKKSSIRKGMVIAHPAGKPVAAREFEAEIVVLYHSTTISINYEAVVHSGASQQCARIISIDKGIIRTGDKAKVRFRYIARPEFLTEGNRLIFREGRAKGIGKITSVIPYAPEKDSHAPHPKAQLKTSNNGTNSTTTSNNNGTVKKEHAAGHSESTANKKSGRRHKGAYNK